jgi:hypothetical protein
MIDPIDYLVSTSTDEITKATDKSLMAPGALGVLGGDRAN